MHVAYSIYTHYIPIFLCSNGPGIIVLGQWKNPCRANSCSTAIQHPIFVSAPLGNNFTLSDIYNDQPAVILEVFSSR